MAEKGNNGKVLSKENTIHYW